MAVKGKAKSFYKRDKEGKFAKVHTLVSKIELAKAQGVKHVEPGPSKKVPPSWDKIKPAAKAPGKALYADKKSGKFKDDHEIFLAAGKLASAHNKAHPNNKISANAVVSAYKRWEYDETGQVNLLGEVLGKLDLSKDTAPKIVLPKTIDEGASGMGMVSKEKFAKPSKLTPTGQTLGGVTGAKVYQDANGKKWVVKTPKFGSNAYSNGNYLVDIEIAASRIQNKAGLAVPAMHAEVVDGKMSAVSKMYSRVQPAFATNGGILDLDVSKLSATSKLEIQQQQVLDWLLSNHDSHSGNFLATDKGIIGIDKGQAFKFFGKDKLHWTYTGTSPLGNDKPVYQTLWKQFANGEGELFDPSKGDLHATIQRLQNIPDAEYRKLLRPYAEKAAADGKLMGVGKPFGEADKQNTINHFLDEAVNRKNNLQKDFNDLYKEAYIEYTKNYIAKAEAKQKADHKSKATMPSVGMQPDSTGAVNVDDLAGQLAEFHDVIPGDVLEFTMMSGQVHEVQVTKLLSTSVIVTKTETGGKLQIAKEKFADGKVKYVGSQPKLSTAAPDKDSDLPPNAYTGDLKVGMKIKSLNAEGSGYDHGEVVQAQKSGTVYVTFGSDDDWIEYVHLGGGVWTSDPQDPLGDFLELGDGEKPAASADLTPNGNVILSPPPPTPDKPGKSAPVTAASLSVGDQFEKEGQIYLVTQKTANLISIKLPSGHIFNPDHETFDADNAEAGAKLISKADIKVSFDSLQPGDKYHNPSKGNKVQTVVSKDVAAGTITVKSPSGSEYTHDKNKFDNFVFSQGIKPGEYVPPPPPDPTPWEKYALGHISWSEYQQLTGAPKAKKLGPKAGPELPPIETKEAKAPPTWDKIKGDDVKLLGQQIYDMKREGKFADDHELWKAAGKLLNQWKKNNPNGNAPSQNQVRNAARRIEFDETGSVTWVSVQAKTAKQVSDLNTEIGDINHVPVIKRSNDNSSLPLTAFGDTSATSGSYLNPHSFGDVSGYSTNSSVKQMKAFGSTHITKQNKSSWSPSQWSAMKHYTAGGYKGLNAYLRTGKGLQYGDSESKIQSYIKNLDAAFKSPNVTPLKDWIVVTRGTGVYDVGIPGHHADLTQLRNQIGKTVQQKGYLSTSFSAKPAFGGQVRMIYRLPPGLRVLYVDGNESDSEYISSHGGPVGSEREIILPRNLKFKVMSVEKSNNYGYQYDAVVEVIEDPDN